MYKSSSNKKMLLALIIVTIASIAIILSVILGFKIKESNNQITNIFVSVQPNKTVYYVGEDLEFDGLVIGVTNRKGKTEYIEYDENIFHFTGFNSNSPKEEQRVYIYYNGLKCSFYVKIIESPKPQAYLIGIELIQLPKTTYKKGEWLELDAAILLLKYSDNTTLKTQIVYSHIYGYSNEVCNTPGTYTLTVRYKEDGILAETTFDITVTE